MCRSTPYQTPGLFSTIKLEVTRKRPDIALNLQGEFHYRELIDALYSALCPLIRHLWYAGPLLETFLTLSPSYFNEWARLLSLHLIPAHVLHIINAIPFALTRARLKEYGWQNLFVLHPLSHRYHHNLYGCCIAFPVQESHFWLYINRY
jgi:hypothetical protein